MFNLGCAYRCGKRLCGSHKIIVSFMSNGFSSQEVGSALFVACKLSDGSYKFIELPYGCCVVGVYSEQHLMRCYRALVDNGLASDFSKDS